MAACVATRRWSSWSGRTLETLNEEAALMKLRPLVLCMCLLVSSSANAQESEPSRRLTDRGRAMLTGSVGGWFSPDDPATRTARWSIDLRPGFYLFVQNRFAVGAYCGVGVQRRQVRVDSIAIGAGGGLQVLYEVELGERLGLVLAPWLGYDWWRETYAADSSDQSQALQIGLSLPLLVHLSDSVGVGFGPYAELNYVVRVLPGQALRQRYGVTSTFFWSF